MERDKAAQMIRDVIVAEIEIGKAFHTGNGKVSLAKSMAERRAVSNLFKELTGEKPTDEEVQGMVEYLKLDSLGAKHLYY